MKRKIAFLVVFMLLIGLFPTLTQAASGTGVDYLSWSFNAVDGTLRISGNGTMHDYSASYGTSNCPPWKEFSDQIVTVLIENGVTSIGNSAFYEFKALKTVRFSDTVEVIGNSSFYNCSALEEVYFGSGLKTVKSEAFYKCSNVRAVHITDLKSWAETSFPVVTFYPDLCLRSDWYYKHSNPLYYAEELYLNGSLVTKLTLPETTQRIGDAAFVNAQCLQEVVIPDSVKSIGAKAFEGCGNLKKLTVGKGVEFVSAHTFLGCNALEGVYISDLAAWAELDFSISYYYFDYGLDYIIEYSSPLYYAEKLYLNNELVTTANIPDTAAKIGDCAFINCRAITRATIPESVGSVGESAFEGCSSLKTVSIANENCEIFDEALTFGGNTSSTKLLGKENSTSQAYARKYDYPFELLASSGGENTEEGNIVSGILAPAINWKLNRTTGVLYITGTGEIYAKPTPWADYIKEILTIEIEEGITAIGSNSFRGATNLERVSLPESLKEIWDDAFYGCTNLKSIRIPKNVISIDWEAFACCTSLNEVIFDGVVKEVIYSAFLDCDNIKTVRIAQLSDWFEFYFDYTYGIPNVIPELTNPLNAGADLYVGDTKVTHLVIPQGTAALDEELFNNCTSITSAILPHFVTSVEDSALNCPNLVDVVVLNPQCTFSNYSMRFGKQLVIHAALDSKAEAYAQKRANLFHACNYTDNKDGTHNYYCAVCKENKMEDAPHELVNGICVCGYNVNCSHKYQNTVTVSPTCTESGRLLRQCTLCGRSDVYLLLAKDHAYESVVTEPTCTEQGYTTHICPDCGDSYVDNYTDLVAHQNVVEAYEVPTCTTDGYMRTVCVNCGKSDETVLPATGHSYAQIVTEPTCTEGGYTTYACACGESFISNTVEALGHDWEGTITLPPTETETGVMTYTCNRCAAKRTEILPATGENTSCDGGDGCESGRFEDVNASDWFHEYVDFAVSNGLFGGMSETTFEPNTAMTRAMLVTVLWRYAGQPKEGTNKFSDVPEGQWYTDAVAWAAHNGIVGGVGNHRFDPNGNITREQMATILYRYASGIGLDTTASEDLERFPDGNVVSDYAKHALRWAVAEGLINGSDGQLLPQGNATRAQVAAIMMRFIENTSAK